MTSRSGSDGFTLIEVLVALTVGGLAVSGAAALLHGMGDRADDIRRAAVNGDADANGERLLRAFLGNLNMGGEAGPPIAGDSRSLTLRTWCEQPEGWLARCVVRVTAEPATGRLLIDGATWRRGLPGVRLLYLVHARQGGAWADRWSEIVAPAAIGVTMEGDTLILPVWGGG